MPIDQAHDQGWWLTAFGWVSACFGAFFAALKFVRFGWKKIDRLLSLPEHIEEMAKLSLAESQRVTEELSDRLELLDGRFKLGQMSGVDAFLELDANGVATFASAVAVNVLGRTQDECVGNGWWNSIDSPGQERLFIRDRWVAAKTAGERFEYDTKIFNEWTRTRTEYRLRIIPIHRAKDGKLLGWKAILGKPTNAMEETAPNA